MIYTESEMDSLRRFMRVESPLAAYARTLRNDGSQATEVEPDLLKGIDTDNLPEDLLEKLTKANDQYKETFKSAKAKETEASKALELAKNHQSRADRLYELARKHNLLDDKGQSIVNVPDAKSASLQKTADRIAKEMGVKAEVAIEYAKMLQIDREEMKKELMAELGSALNPTFQTVGSLQADRLLDAEMSKDAEGILQIESVYKNVKENLDALIQAGTQVLPETVSNLKDLAFGQYVRGLKPEEREKALNTQTASFSTRRGGIVSAPVIPEHKGSKEPVAANADTEAAVAQTLAHLKRGLPAKKGGK